ncbi:MAG: DUF2628 domain-containing protein [Deltaproteobacteria bacterium]|nr:DUF2628 domain-containing protein [Deltaproteobacteria bacterium]
MICPYCKETVQDGATKCRYCGSMINLNPANTINIDTISSDEIRAFVGANAGYYIQSFSKFTIAGREKFCVTWNWSCFAFTFLWLLYRKMYASAFITFVVFCIPGVNIILHIGIGMIGNYLYYRQVKGKIIEIRATQSAQNFYPLLEEMGGVNKWVISTGVIMGIIIAILFVLFFSTMIAFMGEHISRITI